MGDNNIYVNYENVTQQINNLNTLITSYPISDKITEIISLISNNLGDTATALQSICGTLLVIEASITELILSTSDMLSYVEVAYDTADTVEINQG